MSPDHLVEVWGPLVADLLGIVVNLKTGNSQWGGTDDHLYVGVVGTAGGREFPLDVVGFDDFEAGTEVIYRLGAVWTAGSTPKKGGALTPANSAPGGWNDPARWPVDLDAVQFVYLRKGGTRSGQDDDLYELDEIHVTLYGPEPDSRTFSRNQTIRLANEYGLQVWIPEL